MRQRTAHYDSFRNRRRPDLRTKGGVVYAKRPFGGPEAVLRHLGRYTHRIAIGNERLLGCENDEVAESAQVDFAAIRRLTLITPCVTIAE